MESIKRTSHSTFVKSDLQKFDFTCQFYRRVVESDLLHTISIIWIMHNPTRIMHKKGVLLYNPIRIAGRFSPLFLARPTFLHDLTRIMYNPSRIIHNQNLIMHNLEFFWIIHIWFLSSFYIIRLGLCIIRLGLYNPSRIIHNPSNLFWIIHTPFFLCSPHFFT